MEEACANGDVIAAKKCFAALFKPVHGETTNIGFEMLPGGTDVVQRSLCLSARNGQLATFTFLLDQGIPITRSVISIVCSSGRLDFCEAMLQHGWDVNILEGRASPLYEALKNLPCTRWLLEHGADPNLAPLADKDVDILTIAAARSPPEVVRLLVQHGAKTRGTRALHVAAATSGNQINESTWTADTTRVEVIGILLDGGADVNEMEADPKGWQDKRPRTAYTGTPLHYAIEDGSVAAAEYLLARDADTTAPSWSGHTALQAAEFSQRRDMIDALKRHTLSFLGPCQKRAA